MKATEVLRRLLDERGVEWTANDGEYVKETCWTYMGELTAAFAEYNDGTTRFACDTWCFTPAQAIAATLGSGECEIETTENWLPAERYHRCKHCGAFFAVMNASGDIQPCVCPNCGKAVKR